MVRPRPQAEPSLKEAETAYRRAVIRLLHAAIWVGQRPPRHRQHQAALRIAARRRRECTEALRELIRAAEHEALPTRVKATINLLRRAQEATPYVAGGELARGWQAGIGRAIKELSDLID
jgi:hypothetical protein